MSILPLNFHDPLMHGRYGRGSLTTCMWAPWRPRLEQLAEIPSGKWYENGIYIYISLSLSLSRGIYIYIYQYIYAVCTVYKIDNIFACPLEKSLENQVLGSIPR